MFHGVGDGTEKCISCVEVFKKKFGQVSPCSSSLFNVSTISAAVPVDEADECQLEGPLDAQPAGDGRARGGEALARRVHNGLAGSLRR